VIISVEAAKEYYRRRARDWELQMMIKARLAAGDPDPARELLGFVEPLIYSTTLDFSAVEAVSEARARIHEQARAKRAAGKALDIKLTPGGIRDVEFCVQCLQRLHGGREPWVRHGGTLLALARLRDKELLSPAEYATLANAYQFLRHLEHRLQFAHDQQTHALPEDPEELEIVALRMPPIPGREAGRESLLRSLNAHLESVQQIYERVIHAQKPVYYNFLPPARQAAADLDAFPAAELPSNLVRFLDKLAPELAKLVAQGRPCRNPARLEFLLEKAVSQERWLRLINDPVIAAFTLDIFETAPYLAEQLARSPAYLEELAAVRNASEASFRRPPRYEEAALEAGDPARLRHFFHREMFRIQAESLCLRRPVFETLARTSALADAVIAAAYQMAIWHVQGTRPPEDPAYFPQSQLLVIALGRLGVCEFDLGSDADLVFILPDEDAAEIAFWTRVAERLIECLSSYTPAGIVFSVDTRLRPNGKDSPLVQRASALLDYFQKSAEAWEGIAYMKARGVAGDPQQAIALLNQVQELDFRRYGQSGRSKKQLERMRMRLEKEQGAANPLKSGFGGYYDIDFALMYLRLRGAGIFFKTLNTPERIDIVEKMGHLDQPDARFLLDGATLYRAVDHGLRLLEGQAPGALPASPVAREQLANMVERWTPDHLHDQPLELELAQIQSRTREYFERLFG
jgi:glutamate-ammonia-ligase adenylyltransferase